MFNRVLSIFSPTPKQIRICVIKGKEENVVLCKAGDNLMDVTNRIVNQNINIYGLCDKQLACTTCRVDLESHYDQLPPPTEEEIDVLLTTRNFQEGTSRMACQIVISDEMEGMIVRIEREGSLKTNNID